MLINLNDNFRLTSDDYCFIIEEKKTVTKRDSGEQYEKWESKWYFPTIEQAVSKFIDYDIRTTEVEGIDNIIKAINSSKKAIIKEIKKKGE